MFLVALLQCNFLYSLAGSRWRLKIQLGWSFCWMGCALPVDNVEPRRSGRCLPLSERHRYFYKYLLMSFWTQLCDILNALQKSVGSLLFFTVEEHKVNHSEALTRHQAQPDRRAGRALRRRWSRAWPDPAPHSSRPRGAGVSCYKLAAVFQTDLLKLQSIAQRTTNWN